MSRKVSTELIQRQGEELQRVSIPEARARELAAELEGLNAAVFDAARALEFDDEPAGFARLLRAAAREGAGSDER